MRRIVLIAITFLTQNVSGQIDNIKAKSVNISKQFENAESDTIPQISYVNYKSSDRISALYINGRLFNQSILKTTNPELIDSIKVVHQDIEIKGRKYFGQIYIQMKKDYNPKLISLVDLKLRYTNRTKDSYIFMIDNELISGDYSKYLVDEKYILKIIVENIVNKEGNLHINVIRLLTRTEENIKESKEIRIRGTEDLLFEK